MRGKQINQTNFACFHNQYVCDACQEKAGNSDINTDVQRLWGFCHAWSTEDVNLSQSSYWPLAQLQTACTFSAANAFSNRRVSVVAVLSHRYCVTISEADLPKVACLI